MFVLSCLCFFFSMCCVGAQLFHIFLMLFPSISPPLKYKNIKKCTGLMCVVEGDTALFFYLLLFVLLLPHVSCRSMALLLC